MLSSVGLSIRLSVTRVDQLKMVEVRIMKFSPYSAAIPLVYAGILRNSPSGGVIQGRGGKTSHFF